MRVLVCGDRNMSNASLMAATLAQFDVTLVIEGGARGADTLARLWAQSKSIPYNEYPADWNLYGRAAGPIRNKRMLEEGKPELVVAFLAPVSRGTRNMIEQAQKANITTHVVHL